MDFKYLGHACFQANIGGKNIVFDPFIRGNDLAIAAGINIDDVKADYILVSHGHSDHVDDLLYLAEKTNATIITSAANGTSHLERFCAANIRRFCIYSLY